MKKFFLFFLIFLISFNIVYAIPKLPVIISGDVYINGKLAKIGTEITAKVNNEEVNKVEVKEKGKFTLLLQKLNEGDEVNLYVDGIDTLETINYKDGDYKQLILKVEKSYLRYYLTGGLIALIAILVIWRLKRK